VEWYEYVKFEPMNDDEIKAVGEAMQNAEGHSGDSEVLFERVGVV
jgi:hypothetical protein